MQQTTKYQFNLIEGGDDFSPNPLNENMEKVEAQLGAVAEQFGAVDKSLAAVAANLGAVGKNARIAWGTYTGTGTYGANSPTSLDVGFYPVLAFVGSASYTSYNSWPTKLIRDCPASSAEGLSSAKLAVTWTETSIIWYSTQGAGEQDNTSGTVYYYCVLGYDNSAE